MTEQNISIHPVDNKKILNAFIKFPHLLHKNQKYWVPPILMNQKVLLNPDKHPFYEHAKVQFLLAQKNGHIVGCIAAIIDYKHNETHNENTGFFGFFETVEDYDVAENLLTSACNWILSYRMTSIRGPVNPSQHEDCGLLINAFESSPSIMMPYNPPYYVDFIGLFKILLYAKKIDFIRTIIMGIIHKYQKKGIDTILYLDTWCNAVAKGYWQGEMSWVLENNEMMNRSAKMLGGKIYKKYRIFEMPL